MTKAKTLSPADEYTRRALMRVFGAAAAAVALKGCLRPPHEPVLPLPNAFAVADVHCHIFNITDLPAADFVRDVVVEKPALAEFVGSLVEVVQWLLRLFTPTPEEEIEYINRHGIRSLAQIEPIQPETDEERVSALATFIRKKHVESFDSIAPSAVAERMTMSALNVDQRFLWIFYHRAGSLGQLDANSFTEVSFMKIARAALTPAATDSEEEARADGGSSCGLDAVARAVLYAVRWVFFFTYYRHRLLAELMRLHGGSGARIFTPALVDFDYWLQKPESNKPSPQDAQNRVMSRIAKMDWKRTIVQPIAAFDPLRQLADELSCCPPRETAAEVVKRAVTDGGAIGIKIYPPMGFRPWGNEILPFFGKHIPKAVKEAYGHKLGCELDKRLDDIYRFAAGNNVAIMTHTLRTQGAWKVPPPPSSERADPRWWEELLNHQDKDQTKPFRKLRINLGHAGGPWCLVPSRCRLAGACNDPSWFEKVMFLLADERFENLYADIADFDAVMDPRESGRLDDIVTAWICLLKRIEAAHGRTAVRRVLSRLLYGTDWLLLGRSPGSGSYAERMRENVAAPIGEAFDVDFVGDLFFRNTVRFLGLDRPQIAASPNARDRIEKFLDRDLAWIDEAMR